jgi:outer membrane protein assembly factor BamE (lipoprotein component of BamABCDE complex)
MGVHLKISKLLPISLALFLTACATSGKINTVSLGMTKHQVIETMGPPDAVSAQGSAEYLSYNLCASNCAALIVQNRVQDWYYVRLINGNVDSYGRKGDFDSTKIPTTRLERLDTVKQDVRVDDSRVRERGDKYEELTKLKAVFDANVITKQEYEEQKMRILAR